MRDEVLTAWYEFTFIILPYIIGKLTVLRVAADLGKPENLRKRFFQYSGNDLIGLVSYRR
jgi:hypothetical protein